MKFTSRSEVIYLVPEITQVKRILQLLPTPKPSRTCIQAAKLPGDVDVEIEAIAAA